MSLQPEQIPTPKQVQEMLHREQPKAEAMGQVIPFPEHVEDAVSERRVATRPQGPPDHESANPVMVAPAEHNIELPASAKLVVTVRPRGGAYRPQGPAVTGIDDLVKVDNRGRGHIGGSHNSEGRSRNGQFLTKHEMDMITAHQDEIRSGLDNLHKVVGQQAIAPLAAKNRDVPGRLSAGDAADGPLLMPEGFSTGAWDLLNDEQRRVAIVEWGKLSAEEKAAMFDPDHAEEAASEVQDGEPVIDLSTKGLTGRTKRLFAKGKQQLARLYTTVGNKIINPFNQELTETQKKRRVGIIAIGVGAVAVGRVYMMLNGMHHGGGGVPNKDVLDALSGRGGGSGGAGAHAHEIHMTLHHGDTIWNGIADTAAKNGHHFSYEHVRQLTEQTLKANGLSWADARHLPVGYHFDIPREVQEQLAKKAA